MRMRALHLLVAAALGVAVALLVACGSSGSGKIPSADATRLDRALNRVAADTRAGNCDAAEAAVVRAQGVALNLPDSVDRQLRARVRAGIANLGDRVPIQCQQAQTGETTTQQQPTQTQTPPADTQTTDTTDTTGTSTTDTSTTDTSTTSTSTTDTAPTTSTGTGTTTTGATNTTPPSNGGTGGATSGGGQ
jgi:hypothetical protein